MKLNELVYSVSSRIAKKAGLQYSTEDPKELQSFIEDLIPALSPELTHGSVTFGDFWKYYEDDSWLPVFIAAFDRETAKRFHKESPIACELTYGGDTDAEDFDNPDDATGDVIYATCEEFPDGTIYEVLEQFREFSKKEHAVFEVTIGNLYALGTGDATWHFEDGVMSGENTWVIEDQGGQDADLFLVNAWWLREALWGMTPETCEAFNIDSSFVEELRRNWENRTIRIFDNVACSISRDNVNAYANTIIDRKMKQYDRVAAAVDALNNSKAELAREKEALENELSHLGIFAGKRKREIRALLEAMPEREAEIIAQGNQAISNADSASL